MTKSFIVTGASRGLGLAIAKFLVREGHNVVASARNSTSLEEFRTSNPSRIRVVAGDISDSSIGKQLVQVANKEFGQLDGLVVNHGMIEPVQRIADFNIEEWKHNFDVNFFSAVSLIQVAIPDLRSSKGRIVITSSGAASNPYSAWGPYCAAKAALKSFTSVLGVEEKDITTVDVAPGVVDTDMQASLRDKYISQLDEKDQDKFLGLHRDGKMLKPEQPGNVIARLVVGAPQELSGKEIRWNGQEVKEFQDS